MIYMHMVVIQFSVSQPSGGKFAKKEEMLNNSEALIGTRNARKYVMCAELADCLLSDWLPEDLIIFNWLCF